MRKPKPLSQIWVICLLTLLLSNCGTASSPAPATISLAATPTILPSPSTAPATATFPALPSPAPKRAPATVGPSPSTEPATPTPSVPVATRTLSWHLILLSYNHVGIEIWTIDPASGAAKRQIRPNDVVQHPVMSPVGDTIAYIHVAASPSATMSSPSELWLMDRDGANPHPLYVPEAEGLQRLAWQPDGQAIYFQDSSSTLFRIPLEGGEPTAILSDCLDFALSPDGEQLVSVTQEGRLRLSDRDGENVREIAPQPAALADYGLFAFSPDGCRLAFRGSESGRDTWNLYVMDLADLQVRRLTDLASFEPFTPSSGQVNGLAWTADGAHLVYSVDGHPEQMGIWVIGLEDEEQRRLFAWEEGKWAAVMGPWFEQK